MNSVINASNMLDGSGLSTANYDATLIGWDSQTLQSNVTLGAYGLHYCQGGTARNNIISGDNWTFSGDSKDCSATVETEAVTSIDSTTATGNGKILTTNGEDPERFIQWGTTSGTYTNECSAGPGGVGTYSCVLTGLTPNTTYYIRAKATTSTGTNYGSEMSFTTTSISVGGNLFRIRGNIKFRGSVRFK